MGRVGGVDTDSAQMVGEKNMDQDLAMHACMGLVEVWAVTVIVCACTGDYKT